MQKLLSRSKHEEFESNLALQIKDQKERRAENTRKLEHRRNFAGLRKFRKPAKFCRLRKFAASCEIASCQSLFTLLHYSPFLLFEALTICSLLVFFLFCPQCNSVCYVILVICKGGLAIKSPQTSTVETSLPLIKIYF